MGGRRKAYLRVPYGLSLHDHREAHAVLRIIQEHRTMLGEETAQFENAVARLFGKKFGIMVNSGSSANLLALELLDLPRGSEVITPVLTFNTTLAPILQKGLKPVFVDVCRDTFLADLDQVEKKITRKTKALLIPSLLGNVPDMARLRRIARKHKLAFIEDSCDTLGAKFRGKPTGSYSDISTTSFYGSHVINAAGGGGMICVNNQTWYNRLKMLRGWGRTSSLFADSEEISKRFTQTLDGIPYDGKFIFAEIGYNFLPLEISAAFGRIQLEKFSAFSSRRRKNFETLLEMFSSWTHSFDLPMQTAETKTNWLAFPLTVRKKAPFSRFEIVRFLERRNIQTRPVFSGNVLRHPAYKHLFNAKKSRKFPVADHVMKDSFLIGCHQGLRRPHLQHIKKSFEEFLGAYERRPEKRTAGGAR
ncbi:aminotransferase class I/II-fold pyridoxal phosphate-dependent enzyme [Acidobacteria bacterium AH-259-L09]|nr:aminotransferase class I/II-fold pyridoxal phosphate-dependent enzyme [Acidobacteria bacterium AH-259-L09]